MAVLQMQIKFGNEAGGSFLSLTQNLVDNVVSE